MKLNFGVIETPYRYDKQKLSKKGKPLKKKITVEKAVTTFEVAGFIEKKYSLLEVFFRENERYIKDQLTESLEKAIEAVMSGAPPTFDPFGRATANIETLFKVQLSSNAFDWKIPGVPTAASGRVFGLRWGGVNHRLAHPYAWTNPPRPSFIDTGIFQSSFKVWMDNDK